MPNDYQNRQREQYDAEAVLVGPVANLTTTTNGSGIEVGANNELEAKLQVRGAVTGTSPTLDVTIEEDDDNTFGSPTVIATFSQVTDLAEITQMFRTSKNWIRAVATVGGTSPDFGDVEVFLVN